MWLALAAVLAAAPIAPAAPDAGAPQAAGKQLGEGELHALLRQLQGTRAFGKRIDLASAAFLGVPYVIDPLGEGPGAQPDPDPIVRYDGVDCVTYVEEVLALSQASSLDDATAVLQKIRYLGDAVAYTDRNHFMESEWIPSNIRKGFVKDVTAQVGGTDVIHDSRTFTAEQWKARTDATQLEVLPENRRPLGKFDLVALPLDKVEAHAAAIPEGAILVVAHKSDDKTSNRYSHLGFVVRHDGQVFVRHASSLKHGVIEDTLAEFVAKNRKYKEWPVSGFVFLQPLPRNAKTASR